MQTLNSNISLYAGLIESILSMPSKMVGAIFQKRELKFLMIGENDVIGHVISIVLQECIQGLKYSARLKVHKLKSKKQG